MAGSGDEKAATAAVRGRLRASHADREQMIDTLKAAFVQGRLTKDEFDARIGQALVSRTYAELATVTADIPAGLAGAPPRRKLPRRRVNNAVRWGASGFITPAILAAAFAFASLRGDGGYGAVAFVIAFVYFVFWLSAGADMLWQWHCMSLPTARMCVRCGHTLASHRAPASCAVRLGSLKLQSRCPCAGYVPPGLSPENVDLRLLPTRSLAIAAPGLDHGTRHQRMMGAGQAGRPGPPG
ncbi:MAG: DUF1707 SHOCT-like domain-containing protein [Streptosporangiaceae bacterium]